MVLWSVLTMVWQKVVGHINSHRIMVRSRKGNEYGVNTEYDNDNEMVYNHLMNDKNDWDLWADVDFSSEYPSTDRIQTGHPSGGPPKRD